MARLVHRFDRMRLFSVDGDGNSVSESAPNRAMGFHILNQTIYGVRIAIRVQVDC